MSITVIQVYKHFQQPSMKLCSLQLPRLFSLPSLVQPDGLYLSKRHLSLTLHRKRILYLWSLCVASSAKHNISIFHSCPITSQFSSVIKNSIHRKDPTTFGLFNHGLADTCNHYLMPCTVAERLSQMLGKMFLC